MSHSFPWRCKHIPPRCNHQTFVNEAKKNETPQINDHTTGSCLDGSCLALSFALKRPEKKFVIKFPLFACCARVCVTDLVRSESAFAGVCSCVCVCVCVCLPTPLLSRLQRLLSRWACLRACMRRRHRRYPFGDFIDKNAETATGAPITFYRPLPLRPFMKNAKKNNKMTVSDKITILTSK